MNNRYAVLEQMASGYHGCAVPVAYYDSIQDAQARITEMQCIDELFQYAPLVAYTIYKQAAHTPKFIRKSAWAIVIGLDDLTVYCELDGRVYRAIGTDEEIVFPTFLPEIYPDLFFEIQSGSLDSTWYDVICDFTLLPPFSQEWMHYEDHVMRNPDLACTER